MIMEKGSARGRRVLSEDSVDMMTADQLTPEQKRGSVFAPGFFDDMGWGFCMAVVTGRDPVKSRGTYGWDGGMGT